MGIVENLKNVQAEIHAAARACGRPPESVRLVAVSKTRPPEDIREALAAGQRDFGENYAQEFRDKVDGLGPNPLWHFIGSLQRNKVKYVVGRANLIHDVDSLPLAEEISKRSIQRPSGVLLGVNIGREPQKSGFMPEVLLEAAQQIVALPGISLQGLMCIPPAVADPEAAAPYFEEMSALAAQGRAAGLPLQELSMGMSHDYTVAIRWGATLVRVGTAIFGARA